MRGALTRFLELLLVVAVLLLILGQLLNQPILLGFVETGSMEPTLQPGDSFVAVPAGVAGPVEVGDVVVYRPETLDRERVTHRVVARTDSGFVTKGDGNPFTDQDGGEPPVKRAQIEAKALRTSGGVVVIPQLGTAIQSVRDVLFWVQSHVATLFQTSFFVGTRGLAYLFFLCSLVWYAVGWWREGSSKRERKPRTRETGTSPHLLMLAFAGLIVVAATTAMVLPGGPQRYGVVSTEVPSPNEQIIMAGESKTTVHEVGNAGYLPVVVFLEKDGEGIDVEPTEVAVAPQGWANATVTLSAPPEFGYYRQYLVEHRYLALLPRSMIRALYRYHSWAPIVVVDALVGIPFYLVGVALIGTGRVRNRSRNRDLPLVTRARRAVTNLY